MKKFLLVPFIAAVVLSSCESHRCTSWGFQLKPVKESELRYELIPEDLGIMDALPDRYYETDAFDYAVDNTLDALDTYFSSEMVNFCSLDQDAVQQKILEYVWEYPFYEELMTEAEKMMVTETVGGICNYIAEEIDKTPVRTLTVPEYVRTEGDRDYFHTTCEETGAVYEVWQSDDECGYSLREVY